MCLTSEASFTCKLIFKFKLFQAVKRVTSFNSYQCIVFSHSVNSMEFTSRVSLSSSECITSIESANMLSRNAVKYTETISFLLVSSK